MHLLWHLFAGFNWKFEWLLHSFSVAQRICPCWKASPFNLRSNLGTAKNCRLHCWCLAFSSGRFERSWFAKNMKKGTAKLFSWSRLSINWSPSRKKKWPNQSIRFPCTRFQKGSSALSCLWWYQKCSKCSTFFSGSLKFMIHRLRRKIHSVVWGYFHYWQ